MRRTANGACCQIQGRAGIVSLLDAQIGEGEQQGKLVRRGEQALIQKTLDGRLIE